MKGAILLLLVVTSCTSFRPRLSDSDNGAERLPGGRRGLPADTITGTRWPQGRVPASAPYQQRICRTQNVPSGWAIRAYENDRGKCTRADDDYNIAVIEDLSRYAVDDVIGICADQKLPRGWITEWTETPPTCEGARVKEGSSTGMAIRKRNRSD